MTQKKHGPLVEKCLQNRTDEAVLMACLASCMDHLQTQIRHPLSGAVKNKQLSRPIGRAQAIAINALAGEMSTSDRSMFWNLFAMFRLERVQHLGNSWIWRKAS